MTKSSTSDHTTLLLLATLVSLLVHAAVGMALQNRPFGRIDPALLSAANNVLRVYRAERDEIVEDQPSGGDNSAGAIPAGVSSSNTSLTDLSKALLTVPNTGPAAGTSPPRPAAVLRALPGLGPVGFDARGEVPVALPEALTSLASPPPELTLGYVPESGFGIVSEGAGIGFARSLLGGTGRGGGGIPMPEGRRSDLTDVRPGDDRLLDGRFGSPPIDFAQLALSGTTRLDVPEHLDEDFEYSVTIYQPQPQRTLFGMREPDDPRGYFRVDIRAKRTLSKIPAMPKDVVFIIDTSESITQPWVSAVIDGVRDGLATLNEGDRFNIVLFKENTVFFSTAGIVTFNQAALEKAQKFLVEAQSSGYTDVNAALSRLLIRDVSVERVYDLVLISDGMPTRGVMDTRELINLITRDNDLAASIYCVGVGNRQNKELLDFLAYRNRGFCEFVRQVEQARPALRNLFSRLRYPIIKDVELEAAGLRAEEIFPSDLPNIHQGEQFSIFGRFDQPGSFTMRLHGHNGGRALDFTFTRDLAQAARGDEQLSRDWAFWKLHHLYSEMLRLDNDPQTRKQIRDLSRQYKLKSLYGEE